MEETNFLAAETGRGILERRDMGLMKKIGIFLGNIQGSGGISRVTWILANKLNAFYEIHILSSIQSTGEEYRYADDIAVEFLFQEQRPVHTRFLRLTRGIHDFVKRNSLDILICAGTIYYPSCALAAKGTDVKLICWEHANASIESEHKFQGICRRVGAKNADMIVLLTNADEQMYRERYHVKNCRAICNPIDGRLLGDVVYHTESKKIISVGRLCYQKNFELLVDVANVFLKKNPEWRWDVFGEGECRAAIQEKIDEAGLQKKLVLRGRVSDLYDRYQEYALLVMTSRFEGFPMTLLESTARGIPAVAFDVYTGPNEIIVDGETGVLVPPGDAVAMAEKIQCLADDSELRKKMSARCLEIRNRFSCHAVVKNWREILDGL